MKNDLVVPYLITRFCLVGEEDKSILSPEFQSTLKRAYIHTYTNRLIDPVNKRPEEDKENNNNTITQDTLEPPTKRIKKECYNCKTTKTPYWRRSSLTTNLDCCNACGLYERHHREIRPLMCFGDEIRVKRKTWTRRKKGVLSERGVQ